MNSLNSQEWWNSGIELYVDGRLNIIGERRYPLKVNTFNDLLHVAVLVSGSWVHSEYPITTLPGSYWLSTLMNPKGTAMLKPGRYEDAFSLGLHKGKPALVQVAPVTVYRDSNQDLEFDFEKEETGMFGINFHSASLYTHLINSWSAGCQVFQRRKDFEEFLGLCQVYSEKNSGRFTYTLLETGAQHGS